MNREQFVTVAVSDLKVTRDIVSFAYRIDDGSTQVSRRIAFYHRRHEDRQEYRKELLQGITLVEIAIEDNKQINKK